MIMKELLGSRVIVEKLKKEEKKIKEEVVNGIIIPVTSLTKEEEDQFFEGKVIQVGDEANPKVKVGDIVYYYKLAGLQFENYRIISDKDIIGIKS